MIIPIQPAPDDSLQQSAHEVVPSPDGSSSSPFGFFGLSRKHTATSAAMLLMLSFLCSPDSSASLRIKYINLRLRRYGVEQDAYQAAFKLPDLLAYFLIGGAASISLITILNRYRESGRDEEAAATAPSPSSSPPWPSSSAAGVLLAELYRSAIRLARLQRLQRRPRAGRSRLCVALTRIILPAQLFFFIGSVMSARLQVRKIFAYQAFSPLIYNGGIIFGAVFLHKQLGVYSLAVGVVAGMFLGYALVNAFAAHRAGIRWHPILDFRNPGLPRMVAASPSRSCSAFHRWSCSTASSSTTSPPPARAASPLISNAKKLFNAPSTSSAPPPAPHRFPSSPRSTSKAACRLLRLRRPRRLATLLRRHARLRLDGRARPPSLRPRTPRRPLSTAPTSAQTTPSLLVIFAVTLAIWAVQGIYARAFYAASDTFTPTVTGIIAVILSAPLYWALTLHAHFGVTGLALASDLGILMQTAALALLLHRKRLVSLRDLEFPELSRSLLAAAIAFAATTALARYLPPAATHKARPHRHRRRHRRLAALTASPPCFTGSNLPAQLRCAKGVKGLSPRLFAQSYQR